jgi:hypothetical protein
MHSAAPVLPSRAVRIGKELCIAMAEMDGAELRAWSAASAARIGPLLAQRGRSLAGLGKAIAQGVGQEASAAWSAISRKEGAGQLWRRWSAAGWHNGQGGAGALDWLVRLVRDPRATAIELAVILSARAIVSGGRGEEDTIGLSRLPGSDTQHPPLMQSFFAGIALEALLPAFSDLAHAVHGHLPAQRDPAWNALECRRANLADLAGRGNAAGIAWHLFVDAFVNPAAQHGGIVPGMPLTLHQGLTGEGAAADIAAGASGQCHIIEGETAEQRESDMMRRWIGIAIEP